jgi:D-threo-aldose 1-dehydrogenase
MRAFDTAPLYGLGLSEERFGRAIVRFGRDRIVLSTKIGRVLEDCAAKDKPETIFIDTPNRRFDFDYTYDGVMRSFAGSLERLGTDHIDILYVHDVDVFTHGSQEKSDAKIRQLFDEGGYRAIDELRSSGVVKAIGGGLNEWETCEKLARLGDFDCFLLAGRYTLLEQEALETFLPLCEERGIGIIIGGPYNSGILATGAVEGAYFNYEPAPSKVMDKVRRIEAVCASHNVALVDAAFHFVLGHPSVVSVIPGAQRDFEVARNVKTLKKKMPTSLWSDLKAEGLLRADAPVPTADLLPG